MTLYETLDFMIRMHPRAFSQHPMRPLSHDVCFLLTSEQVNMRIEARNYGVQGVDSGRRGWLRSREIVRALEHYRSTPAYLALLREGAIRVDLDGEPAGRVTKEEAEQARDRLRS
jgi:ProQ/FINO family